MILTRQRIAIVKLETFYIEIFLKVNVILATILYLS